MPLQGVMIDGEYSVEFAITHLSLPSTSVDTTGSTNRRYSSSESINASLEKGITKTGVKLDFYDPELSALLVGF